MPTESHAEAGDAVLLVFGPPGAGKTTLGRAVAADLGVPFVSAGQRLRSAAEQDSALARRLRDDLRAGRKVDPALVDEVMSSTLDDLRAGGGMVLDGYPVDLRELLHLRQRAGRDVDLVLHLRLPSSLALERARFRGRSDDDDAQALTRRMSRYRSRERQLAGALAGRFVLLDATAGPQAVARQAVDSARQALAQ